MTDKENQRTGILTPKTFMIGGALALLSALGVYFYLRHLNGKFQREFRELELSKVDETDEEIEEKIEEIKKYLLQKPDA